MSSALLKFQDANPDRLDPAILAAAIETTPDPLAITENGNVIYQNQSFAQQKSQPLAKRPKGTSAYVGYQTTEFSVAGRTFSLFTRDGADLHSSDLQHLATIGRLVAGIAHDFNNLLTGILLYCDLMLSKTETGGTLWKKTDEIRSAAQQGATLIRQLMTVGRDEPGASRSVRFDHAVRDLEPLLRHLIGEQIQIVSELAGESALVGVSPAQA